MLVFALSDVTDLMGSQRWRRIGPRLTERAPALSATPRTLKRFAERSRRRLHAPNCGTPTAGTEMSDGRCPCTITQWELEPQYLACRTTARPGTEATVGRMTEGWTPTKETCGKTKNTLWKKIDDVKANLWNTCFWPLTWCNAVLCRGPMRMRAERSGRDGPGPSLRGGSSANRGRSSFNDRDGGRPMVMNDQVSWGYDTVVRH